MSDAPPRVVLSLRTWLIASHVAVFALPLIVLVGTGSLASDLRDQTRWDLEHQGALIAMYAVQELRHAQQTDPDAGIADLTEPLSEALAQAKDLTLSGIRITDAEGVVEATSGTLIGEDLSDDPVVVRALSGEEGADVRPRGSPGRHPLSSESRRARVRLFVAMPIRVGDAVVGTVVLSRTPREELQALYHMAPGFAFGAVLAVLSTVGGALLVGYGLTRSLRLLSSGAQQIADGSFSGLTSLARPSVSHVAEVALVSDSVTAMASRLRSRIGYISEFASNVSHEFKTPLATLRGTLELLQDDDEMPAEQRIRFLDNAQRELDRLERQVSGLLTLARADEGGGRGPLELGELVRRGVERFDAQHSEGVEVSGQAGRVHGNADQLEAVLSNLLENAHVHGDAPVRVRAWVEGDDTGFEVIDAGSGISPSNLERVFERFFTTNRSGGGAGLGLALVRAICRAHGGDITAASGDGRTVFRVSLPRLP